MVMIGMLLKKMVIKLVKIKLTQEQKLLETNIETTMKLEQVMDIQLHFPQVQEAQNQVVLVQVAQVQVNR